MLRKIVLSIIVGIVVFLICIFVGGVLLAGVGISWVAAIGTFLKTWAALLGLIAAVWYFFGGGAMFNRTA